MYPEQQSGPSKKGYAFGTLLLILGIVGGFAAIIGGVLAGTNRVNDYQRVPVGVAGRSISFSKPGRYDAYFERPGIRRRQQIPALLIRLDGPGGKQVLSSDLLRTSTNQHYDLNNHEGVRITGFDITTAGTYKVQFQGEPDQTGLDQIAFGKGSQGVLFAGVLGGLLGGGLVGFIGLIVLISTAVRRRNHRRRFGYAAGGGFGSPGPYGPPGGYGPPPGGASPPQVWAPAAPGGGGAWSAPGGPAEPSGQPPGWAPPPGPFPPAAPPPQAPAWPPAGSGPPNDPGRPGWGDPAR